MTLGVTLALLGTASAVFLVQAVTWDTTISAGVAGGSSLAHEVATSTPANAKPVEGEAQGAFYVGTDIATSSKGSLQDGVLDLVDEALGDRLSKESLKRGSTVRVLATEETAAGKFVRYKRLLAIEYRPPSPTASPVRFYGFAGQQARGYFDENGKQPASSEWLAPLAGPMRRTSKFNPKRMHPVLHTVMPHNGTDYGAPTGTPVYAVREGTVGWVGPHGATGNWVSITHPSGIETGYAHLSRFAEGLKRGDHVRTHQLIGYVGSTGRSTGPHLHLSARKNGAFFDVETLLKPGERAMPEGDRAAFLSAKAEIDRRLDAIALPETPPPPPEEPAPRPSTAPASDSTSLNRSSARGHHTSRR